MLRYPFPRASWLCVLVVLGVTLSSAPGQETGQTPGTVKHQTYSWAKGRADSDGWFTEGVECKWLRGGSVGVGMAFIDGEKYFGSKSTVLYVNVHVQKEGRRIEVSPNSIDLFRIDATGPVFVKRQRRTDPFSLHWQRVSALP